jgi:hypothetical protein
LLFFASFVIFIAVDLFFIFLFIVFVNFFDTFIFPFACSFACYFVDLLNAFYLLSSFYFIHFCFSFNIHCLLFYDLFDFFVWWFWERFITVLMTDFYYFHAIIVSELPMFVSFMHIFVCMNNETFNNYLFTCVPQKRIVLSLKTIILSSTIFIECKSKCLLHFFCKRFEFQFSQNVIIWNSTRRRKSLYNLQEILSYSKISWWSNSFVNHQIKILTSF